ncbi:hypothetical protein EV175_001179 [Coemansia sp. RSA 1933]|nr:hypothetical protein EV175_001179 [Coemansia sp. RSA 1933]
MDSFTSTVSSQTLQLDGIDASSSFINIPFCYWYENSDRECNGNNNGSRDSFMPSGIMERAFYKALREFPVICGHLKADTNSRMYVDIDKDNLNMPVYVDTCCDVEYSAIKESGFNIGQLPVDLRAAHEVPAPPGLFGGQIKLGHFYIVRFKGNSGVLVCASIAHVLVDGSGFTKFINLWAETSRWMQQHQDDANKVPLSKCRYIHDRSIHASYRSDQTTALDASILDILLTSNAFSRWLSWISPESRARIFKALSGVTTSTCCYFRISLEALEDLRANMQKYAPAETRYSINDVISAYIVIVVVQAKEKGSTEWWSRPVPSAIRAVYSNSLGKHEGFQTSIAFNMRPRINNSDIDDFVGNMASVKVLWFPQDLVNTEPTDKALATLATSIHEAVAAIDESFVSQIGHLLEKEPDSYMRFALGSMNQKPNMIISSQIRFAHYDVDFGAGIPSLCRMAPCAFPDVAFILPGNTSERGYYEIALNVAPNVALYIIGNPSWMKLVSEYDCYL